SSATLAHSFGASTPFDVRAVLDFFRVFVANYELGLCTAAAIVFVLTTLIARPTPERRFGLSFLGLWVLLPFTIVLLSAFKYERYFYPGEIGVVALAALQLSALTQQALGRAVLAALLVVPVVKQGMTNGVALPPWVTERMEVVPSPPDANDHQINAL